MPTALTPSQTIAEAQKIYQTGDYLEAAQAFKAAENSYLLLGDKLTAAEMANNRSVSLLMAGNAAAALQALQGTVDIFLQVGDIPRQAMALGNRATALESLKRLDEAAADYARSAELLKQTGESEKYTAAMQSLSRLQLRRGQPLEALATMQAGLAEVDRPSLKQRLLKSLLATPSRLLNR